jgi:hypothetical protein
MSNIIDTGPKFELPIQLDIKQNETNINNRDKRQIILREPTRQPTMDKPRKTPLFISQTSVTNPASTVQTIKVTTKLPPTMYVPSYTTKKITKLQTSTQISMKQIPKIVNISLVSDKIFQILKNTLYQNSSIRTTVAPKYLTMQEPSSRSAATVVGLCSFFLFYLFMLCVCVCVCV